MGLQWHWRETPAVAEEVIQVVLRSRAYYLVGVSRHGRSRVEEGGRKPGYDVPERLRYNCQVQILKGRKHIRRYINEKFVDICHCLTQRRGILNTGLRLLERLVVEQGRSYKYRKMSFEPERQPTKQKSQTAMNHHHTVNQTSLAEITQLRTEGRWRNLRLPENARY